MNDNVKVFTVKSFNQEKKKETDKSQVPYTTILLKDGKICFSRFSLKRVVKRQTFIGVCIFKAAICCSLYVYVF